ncbi:MAG: hypothetical protein KAU03_05880, partial [Candidatus Altiarchaeales archaeon]|nr:hypothetical protein [Candidatus Altiarchaeales archaeon]
DVDIGGEKYTLIREKLWNGFLSDTLVNGNTKDEFLVEVPIGGNISGIEKKFEIQRIAHEGGRALKPYCFSSSTGKIVMEMIEGESLHDIMERSKWRNVSKTIPGLKFQKEFGEALNNIHGRGIIHNGLDPLKVGDGRNIMLTEDERVIFVNYVGSELLREDDLEYIQKQINELSELTNSFEKKYRGVYKAYMDSGGFERIGDYLTKHPEQVDEVCKLLPSKYAKKLRKGIESGTTITESDPEAVDSPIPAKEEFKHIKEAKEEAIREGTTQEALEGYGTKDDWEDEFPVEKLVDALGVEGGVVGVCPTGTGGLPWGLALKADYVVAVDASKASIMISGLRAAGVRAEDIPEDIEKLKAMY